MGVDYSVEKRKNTIIELSVDELNQLVYNLENEFGINSLPPHQAVKVSKHKVIEYTNIPSKDILIKSLIITIKEIRYIKLNKYINDLKKQSEKLLEISKFQDNWNDNGAYKFSDKLIANCYSILFRLPVLPEIFPVADGSIQFEYEKGDGSYLEFDIFENDVSEFIAYPDGKEIERAIEIDKIAEEVKNFYEQSDK